MIFKSLKDFVFQLIAGANFATILAMAFTGYVDRLNPYSFPELTNLGLVFPFFLAINIFFLVFWIFFRKRLIWIPLIGLVVCYQPVRAYLPINLQKKAPEDAIKVLSYNVYLYSTWHDKNEPSEILQYLKKQDADIVCLQEAETDKKGLDKINSEMSRIYSYRANSYAKNKADMMTIYSRFTILKQEEIAYDSETNHSTAFYLKIKNDTVIVINNHLQSIGISPHDKANFKGVIKGKITGDSIQASTRPIFAKLNKATQIRAPQAEAVVKFMARHPRSSFIVCGDFNDGPNSFVRRTVAKQLRDCYVETGLGPGISYHLGGFYVRIDHIMCSTNWIPYACEVDNKIKSSDHYPIYCWLKKSPKP